MVIVEVSSGSSDIPNTYMFADDYSDSGAFRRANADDDIFLNVELPVGCCLSETAFGESCVQVGNAAKLTRLDRCGSMMCISDGDARIWAPIIGELT